MTTAVTEQDQERFASDGDLVRASLFFADEVDELSAVVEAVAELLGRWARREGAGPEHHLADGHRVQFSSRTSIQWEWAEGSEQIRLLEPADHVDPGFGRLFDDQRLTGPACAWLGVDRVEPFTSNST